MLDALGMNPSQSTIHHARTPTVSRVTSDTLVELVYDHKRRKTALVVSRFGGLWNVEQEVNLGGEILGPYSATNSLIANGCVLLPAFPVEHHSKAELVADIRAFLHRYVDLSPIFEQITAYYVLLSWVFDAFGELPYLRFLGDYGTGKTRALLAIGSLVYRGIFASGASTMSPIFRMLDAFGGTLILDEADLPASDARAGFVKMLNNGTVRGMPLLRSSQNKSKEFDPRAFKVFGPKVIAAREPFQDPALESRFLTERTGLRSLRADIPIQTPANLAAEALQLRNRLLHFRLCELHNVRIDVTAHMPGLSPRANQMALPLLSLVDDPAVRHDVQQSLLMTEGNSAVSRQQSVEGLLVRTALDLLATRPGNPLSVGEIAAHLNAERPEHAHLSHKAVGEILRTKLLVETHKSNGRYVLSSDAQTRLGEMAKRYGLSS